MPLPIKREADHDLGALERTTRWIALVLVEIRDLFLLPGGADPPRGVAGALRGRDRTRRLRNIVRAWRCRRLRGHGFLRRLGGHSRTLGFVLDRFLPLVPPHH